jgi:hypothetical protein
MKQRLIVALVLLCIAATGLYILFRNNNPSDVSETSTLPTTNIVKIDNVQSFSTWLDPASISSTEQALFRRVASYSKTGLAIYHGTIRPNTFKTTYSRYEGTSPATNVPTVEYVVDITDAKQSYLVRYSGGKSYPYSILYVLCVPKEQMKYIDFGCTDAS